MEKIGQNRTTRGSDFLTGDSHEAHISTYVWQREYGFIQNVKKAHFRCSETPAFQSILKSQTEIRCSLTSDAALRRMFKKSAEPKSLQRLSGADRKKLRRSVKEKFPLASDSDLDLLLPPKAEITVAKFQNRVLVYAVEGGFPVFFDIDGRGAEVPHLLPSFTLKGGEVSHFIIGGADLMFPGISFPPDGVTPFSAGEPWSVKVPGNPAPFAVGTTTMSSHQALQAGLRGKALRIGISRRSLVYLDPSLPSSASDYCEVDPSNEQQSDLGAAVLSELDLSDHFQAVSDVSSADKGDMSEQLASKMSDLKASDDTSIEDSYAEADNKKSLSASDVDRLLDQCLLQALHTTIKDKDLPMPGSILWSNHVLACRPAGVTLDIRKSSFKKLSKWLQSKASAGLISVKEDKFKKEVVLFSVNRGHSEYMSYKPEKKRIEMVEQSDNKAAVESQSGRSLVVEEVYKPISHVTPIFASVGSDTGGIYSASEATAVVFSYIEKENLVKSIDRSVVILDATLCDALFKGAIKKGSTYPTEIHKKDIGQTFLSRMQAHQKVIRGSDIVVKKGAIKPIQIMTERRQGNKKVTKVSGFEPFLVDGESLASELQKKFACSTTIAELPGKKGMEVLIQGGVIDHLGKHLVEHYGIPKRYIELSPVLPWAFGISSQKTRNVYYMEQTTSQPISLDNVKCVGNHEGISNNNAVIEIPSLKGKLTNTVNDKVIVVELGKLSIAELNPWRNGWATKPRFLEQNTPIDKIS
ncbi:hypothetical protein V2J09_016351 [Rumex salicifolius]